MDTRGNQPDPSVQADLIITSQRRRHRFLGVVLSQPVWLTAGETSLLLELAAAQAKRSTYGFVKDELNAYPTAICRLRQKLDRATTPGVGMRLIETGVGREYRLAPWVRPRVERRAVELLELEAAFGEALNCGTLLVDAEELEHLLSDSNQPDESRP